MEILDILRESVVVPVVVLEKEADAVPTANALLEGGVNVMEITFRTAAAEASIEAVAKQCPQMLVGAGTIVSLEQCKFAVSKGAKFIVSPGFDAEIVSYCRKEHIPVVPGCVTPTEIMKAKQMGLKVVKFFPANVYGGLDAMKNLAAPFSDMKFIPTGGVNSENIKQYFETPFIHAVGGSWICPKTDIENGNFDKITNLCKEARKAVFE